jgi:hypothetical protein
MLFVCLKQLAFIETVKDDLLHPVFQYFSSFCLHTD